MIFIVWRDIDITDVEDFDIREIKAAEERLAELLNMQESGEDDTEVLAVIQGEKLNYSIVERVKTIVERVKTVEMDAEV